MKKLTTKEFTKQFVNFLKELHLEQDLTFGSIPPDNRLTDQESIVDLFRLWFMDSREMEMIEETRQLEGDKGYSDGY